MEVSNWIWKQIQLSNSFLSHLLSFQTNTGNTCGIENIVLSHVLNLQSELNTIKQLKERGHFKQISPGEFITLPATGRLAVQDCLCL